MAPLRAYLFAATLATAFGASIPAPATAQTAAEANPHTYSSNEILDAGHRFFGTVSRDLALLVERATMQWGQPNGYILGQEASGATCAERRSERVPSRFGRELQIAEIGTEA